ncbi:MAG: hypothetical protein ACTSO9_11130 [Candidatus Helarchaeota archaeon]
MKKYQILLIIGTLTIGFILSFQINRSIVNNNINQGNKIIANDIELRSSGWVNFTYSPLDSEAFINIIPLGALFPPIHTYPIDHVYYELNNTHNISRNVYAPAAGTIFYIQYYHVSDENGTYDDYSLGIRHTSTFISHFMHIANLSGPLSGFVGHLALDQKTMINVPVSAGEVFATTWIHAAQINLDWTLENHQNPLPFIHPETYWSGTAYCDCPCYFLNGTLYDEARAKCKRTDAPWGGEICYDVPDTISGNWFLENLTFPDPTGNKRALSFAYHWYNSSQMLVSLGNNVTGVCEPSIYNTSGPDWSNITAENGTVTYHLVRNTGVLENYTLIAQIVGHERLKVETFEGHLASPSFTENATYYNRIAATGGSYDFPYELIAMILIMTFSGESFPYLVVLIGSISAAGLAIVLIIYFKKRKN